ncbi:hypothetical protein GE09DRAFT_1280000 [Coniochaeta sp. 2T2.1]|nr:hypothetical protein GE09DRAFT_1280000 [Coniochaeta sp. 2T2.1]
MQLLAANEVDEVQSRSSASTALGLDVNLLFDLSPLRSIVISPSWCISHVTTRFLNDWHVSRDECIGQQLLPFIDKQLPPDGSAAILCLGSAIYDAITSRTERTTEQIITKHAASWRVRVLPCFNETELVSILLEWHEEHGTHVKKGIVQSGSSTDEAFRIFVQAVKDYGIFLLDDKGRIASWNTGAELIMGYKREDIIGQHFSIFYGADDVAIRRPELELETCLREGRADDEGWRYKRDGSRFWASLIITALYKDGAHVGFAEIIRDLTERRASESRLIAPYEEGEKVKSDFLANMSHEIRTPMHAMHSACSPLLVTALSERQQDMTCIMDESGQVLLQVTNDILDYAKLVSGSFSINSDILSISSIIISVVRAVQPTDDPLRYRQILHNLVSNAAKFTDKGGICVTASIDSEDDDSYVIVTEVTDTGIGIGELTAAGLFTRFNQLASATTKRYKGTGLGLSIAKALAELMGGGIRYQLTPKGRFTHEDYRHWYVRIAHPLRRLLRGFLRLVSVGITRVVIHVYV